MDIKKGVEVVKEKMYGIEKVNEKTVNTSFVVSDSLPSGKISGERFRNINKVLNFVL